MNKGHKLYILIVEDRHTDVQARPFIDAEEAIEAAKKITRAAPYPEDYEERIFDGALFSARYTCEGDSVRVMEVELE